MQRRPPTPSIERYEALIFTHSVRLLNLLEERGDAVGEHELDDFRQAYRIKTWTALGAFDPERCRTTVDRWVFFCLKNAEKDMLKRRRRAHTMSLDDLTDASPALALGEEEVYEDARSGRALVPDTLNGVELRVVVLLYRGYTQLEVGRRLGIDRKQMKGVIREVRTKMSDWNLPDDAPIAIAI